MNSPIQVRQLDHITLVVADLTASCAFYIDLLGMVKVSRPAFRFEGSWLQAGTTLVHLILSHDQSGPAGFYPQESRTTRMPHFALEVDDPAAAVEFLKTKDVEFVSDLKIRPDGALQLFVTDPDGHIVELCSSPDNASET